MLSWPLILTVGKYFILRTPGNSRHESFGDDLKTFRQVTIFILGRTAGKKTYVRSKNVLEVQAITKCWATMLSPCGQSFLTKKL